ncbi:MAG: SoxR reducing system RseC family protein [Rhodocyclaceae bacterium]|jgi:sigma-E factor negative regulatory protein RseC
MSEATGTVVETDGNYAIVSTDDAGCGRCHEKGGCGGANVGRMFCTTPKRWRVLNPRGAAVGEQVRIAVGDGAVSSSAMLIYVLPLAFLIAGALLGTTLAADSGGIFGAVLGLLLAWFWVRHLQKRRYCDPRFHPHIL